MVVFHGSSKRFPVAKPSKTTRRRNGKVNYTGVSLHATKYEWIALAYTYVKKQRFVHKGNLKTFTMGVSLFENTKTVSIIGKKSLEYSLKKLYGNGGYLYSFDSKNFKHVKGLGPLEVLSFEEQVPKKIKFVKNIVQEMKAMGVKFIFRPV